IGRRFAQELLRGDTPRQACDLQAVEQPCLACRLDEPHLVRMTRSCSHDVEVPDRRMKIESVDRTVANAVDAVEELAKLYEIGVVGRCSGTPALVKVGAIGWTADRPERDPLASDPNAVAGIACMDGEFRGRSGERVFDDLAADPHPLAVYTGAGAGPDVARLGRDNVHSYALQ